MRTVESLPASNNINFIDSLNIYIQYIKHFYYNAYTPWIYILYWGCKLEAVENSIRFNTYPLVSQVIRLYALVGFRNTKWYFSCLKSDILRYHQFSYIYGALIYLPNTLKVKMF